MIRVAIIAAICGFLVYDPSAAEIMGSREGIVDGLLALLAALLSYNFFREQLDW